MNDFLQSNLEALASIDPLSAAKVLSIAESQKYEVYADNDPANINIIEKAATKPLYASRPVDEVMSKISSLKNQTAYPYLYFYGIGNGIFYRLLLANEMHRRVVVFEPEPELLYIGLHFVDFAEEIRAGRFVPICSEFVDFNRISNLIAHQDAKIYSRLYDLQISLPYYNTYIEDIARINKIFVRAIEHQILSVGNDSTDALTGFQHHVQNIPHMLKSPTVTELVNRLKTTDTAVITSTGPSLHKQLPLLKEIQDHVTIICIDASFPIMHQWGIKPDIVVTLERIALTSEFYKKTPEEFQEGVIFALTSIVHEELRDSITRGIKQFSMRPFGYNRFFGEFIQWGYLGIGMSAANMAYEIAVHSKFKQCVLIGQDLAYGEDGNTHSKGYVLDKDEFKPNNTEMYIEKYGGGGQVRTNNIWQLFLNFFEKDIAGTTSGMQVINATEGGARIHGATEMPFAEVVERFVDRTAAKPDVELSFPSEQEYQTNMEIARNRIDRIIEYGGRVKKEVEETFLEVTSMTEHLEKLNAENRLEEIDFEEIRALIDRIDHIKDYFQEEEFVWLFLDAVQSYIIHQELEIAKIQVRYVEDEYLKKAKLIDWVYAHKYWLFSLAGGMENMIEIAKNASQAWK